MFKRLLLTLLVSLFVSQFSNAAQLGFSLGTADGDGDVSVPGFANSDIDVSITQASFVLNACEICSVFNYRLNVGYMVGDVDYGFSTSDDIIGLNVSNTFGFKLVNCNNFKLWLGASIFSSLIVVDGDVSDQDGSLMYGIGPTVGMDFGVGNDSAIGIELSLRDLHAEIDGDIIEDYDFDDLLIQVSFMF